MSYEDVPRAGLVKGKEDDWFYTRGNRYYVTRRLLWAERSREFAAIAEIPRKIRFWDFLLRRSREDFILLFLAGYSMQ